MTTDITELAQSLKAAAEKATPGRWEYYPGNTSIEYNVDSMDEDQGSIVYVDSGDFTQAQTDRNGEFIALANPASILALVEALEKAQQRNAELEAQNEYIRKRYQQLDLLIGKNILVMQAAIIEWQATGDAKNGLAWIYNTLFGPGELPDEAEKDAQVYFDRKYAPLDEELMALHKWFWEQSEAERAAAGIKV
ncbi:TPA: ead/Ea22-like family protein, partial [Klebsiella pneumoniae]|nr:ead/Ea22-like family protein [Klebsiella pneumoniae]HBZ9417730.1 ead/Ea22-like family protein [Klebsiella pneumoniae]HBZ9846890.1 ead/Ea22-like family protein [Klebsiella pneumoniae]HBZ9928659.1 ead/Ea22-like family protein [Klebsiella pneumoniae]HCA1689735.1 ead/Ea22-like family protein [Klebsiella pneumoniae]